MRKTVIDGSNTSGFQRTILIAKDGYVETKDGKVRIESVCLEEDAARTVERRDKEIVYRLDRLGIPLVEIATSPDIKTPEQAKEVALHLGNILRSCRVKRGIGTIRQDMNVSIKGHDRVEVKGFQDVKMFVKTLELEVERQMDDLKNRKTKGEVRNALPDGKTEFSRPMPGAERMYPETDLPLLKISRNLINEAKKDLPSLRTDIEEELRQKGLNQEMIKLLFKRNKLEEFKELLEISDNPNLIVKLLLVFPREIASHNKTTVEKVEQKLDRDVLIFVLDSLKDKKISEVHIKEVLERVVKGIEVEDAIKFEKEDFNVIEEKIVKILKEKPGLNPNAYTGLIMKEFKGKINGKEVMEIIKRYVKV